ESSVIFFNFFFIFLSFQGFVSFEISLSVMYPLRERIAFSSFVKQLFISMSIDSIIESSKDSTYGVCFVYLPLESFSSISLSNDSKLLILVFEITFRRAISSSFFIQFVANVEN